MRGPHGAEWGGRNPQSNLLSPQNTLLLQNTHTRIHTHTPSGTDSALNFLPVILAAGQRETERGGEREGNFKTAVERTRERGVG